MKESALFLMLILMASCVDKHDAILFPRTPMLSVTDTYHGVEVIDPYRNLENLQDSIVINWFKDQTSYSKGLVSKIKKRKAIFDKLNIISNREEFTSSRWRIKKDSSYFFLKRNKNEEIEKLYYSKSKNASHELIFDPTSYKKEYIINYFKTSWDLSKIAISIGKKGEDLSDIIIYDLERGSLLNEVIKNACPIYTGGISWLKDNSGFIYQHIPNTNYQEEDYWLDTKSVVYELGTNPVKLQEIFSRDHNPEIVIKREDFPQVILKSSKSNYLFGEISGVSSFNDTYYAELNKDTNLTKLAWKFLFKAREEIKQFYIHNDTLIYRTANDASNFKICRTPLHNPDFDNPEVLINEHKHTVIIDFVVKENKIFYTTMKNGVESKFFVFDAIKKSIQEIALPYNSGSSFVKLTNNTVYVSIGGWTSPYKLYRFNDTNNTFVDVTLEAENVANEFSDFIVEEVEVSSHDGEKVPLSIIYKKGMAKDKMNRTMLLSYGAYGDSFSPYFSIPFLTWVSEGGIWAIPHVRGGGEKGNDWHMGGYKTTKPNTWKDLIACTEYLINEKFTSPKYITSFGASAAGIGVARAVTERPDLFTAAVLDAPSINLVRSEIQPNGLNSVKEFGTVKDSVEFRALLEMDAYHHIKKGKSYPAILVLTGMKDGAVVPWDPAKFVARMQNSSSSKKPVLLLADFEANHGGDGTKKKYHQNMADIFSFALWQTGHPDYQPKN